MAPRSLSAEELVAVVRDSGLERRDPRLDGVLGGLGYTWLDYFRAQFWIRRGKPTDYVWDDASIGSQWRD